MYEHFSSLILDYLVIGACLLSGVRIYNDFFRIKKDQTDWANEFSGSLKDIAQTIFAIISALLFWPLVIYFVIMERYYPYGTIWGAKLEDMLIPNWLSKPEIRFNCEKSCLIEKVKPEEVEIMCMVQDPKGRVPAIPFGHLNTGWLNLLGNLEKGDVLWSFKTPGWTTKVEGTEANPQWSAHHNVISGYAVVRKGEFKAEFLTEWDDR